MKQPSESKALYCLYTAQNVILQQNRCNSCLEQIVRSESGFTLILVDRCTNAKLYWLCMHVVPLHNRLLPHHTTRHWPVAYPGQLSCCITWTWKSIQFNTCKHALHTVNISTWEMIVNCSKPTVMVTLDIKV